MDLATAKEFVRQHATIPVVAESDSTGIVIVLGERGNNVVVSLSGLDADWPSDDAVKLQLRKRLDAAVKVYCSRLRSAA